MRIRKSVNKKKNEKNGHNKEFEALINILKEKKMWYLSNIFFWFYIMFTVVSLSLVGAQPSLP